MSFEILDCPRIMLYLQVNLELSVPSVFARYEYRTYSAFLSCLQNRLDLCSKYFKLWV